MLLRRNLIWVIILLILIVPALADNFRSGYFSMHDDLQTARLLVMDKCLADGQLPCRWSEDLGYGFGYPLFNFYPPFPYYLGETFHLLGLTFLDTVKALVIANFIVAALTMYLLAKEFWGKAGGLISAVFYTYAPYHAVDLYVRGAMDEAWALAWFPLIFWSLYRLVKFNQWRYVFWLSLATALLMLSHNPMLMVFSFGALLWTAFWLWQFKTIKVWAKLVLAAIWSLSLAAFFTLPVLLEQQYVHVESLIEGYFNYLAHYATINQLFFSRFWGYGGSILGPNDGLSFQIGQLHWLGALLSLVVAAILWKRQRQLSLMLVLVFGLTTFYTFMTHQRSSFIWDHLPPLAFLQFPWRFLALSIFGCSLMAGSMVILIRQLKKPILQKVLFVALLFGCILFYKDYFHWGTYYPDMTDAQKFSGKLWQLQTTGSIFDYLPKTAPLPPAHPATANALIIKGQAQITDQQKNSIWQQYQINSQTASQIEVQTLFFPGWHYYLDQHEVKIDPARDPVLGLPIIDLSRGNHTLSAQFKETPIRQAGDWLSLLAWGLLIFYLPRIIKR